MKKLFAILIMLFCINACWGFDYAEKQDDGSMFFMTTSIEEIEKYLGVSLPDYTVIAQYNTDKSLASDNFVLVLHPNREWEVFSFTETFMFVFMSKKRGEI